MYGLSLKCFKMFQNENVWFDNEMYGLSLKCFKIKMIFLLFYLNKN
jgi:hypothetical protein